MEKLADLGRERIPFSLATEIIVFPVRFDNNCKSAGLTFIRKKGNLTLFYCCRLMLL
ncbi:hypothetical protein NC652_012471 [Populus alba x Populus x berolinensis]|nr:hypothetical protein NC652_012471 [Populus alba x Populus x berolinensis]